MKQWNLSLEMITIQKGIHLILQQQCYIVCFILGYSMITLKCSPVNHMDYTMHLPPLIQKKQKKYMNKCNYLEPDTVMAFCVVVIIIIVIDLF